MFTVVERKSQITVRCFGVHHSKTARAQAPGMEAVMRRGGGADGFPPGGGDRRKPHARAGAGKRSRSPRKTTASAKPHLSGQPDGAA